MIRKFFDLRAAPLLAIAMIALVIAENRHQLRKRKANRNRRYFTNALVSVPAFTLLRLAFLPAVVRLANKNQNWKLGINHLHNGSSSLKFITAFLILDYSNYVWHILNHKLPLLWRFHVVHHSDHDLDVSTAIRFHFGELIGSILFRGLWVILSGATALQLLVYEVFFEAANQFHHSNMRLPYKTEKVLNYLIVTPRMHGIHHSNAKDETDSNYSVIFSFWDRLHHTIRLNIHQDQIVIGVPAYPDADELTVEYLLKLPFLKMRKWNGGLSVERGHDVGRNFLLS
jgi:sterol desaturase/sphingolipid hydroxylase (fatty acid hydroxylase superfamily)